MGFNFLKKDDASKLLGRAYRAIENQNFESARELLEKALEITQVNPEIHSEYAMVLSASGHFDRAIDHMIRAIMLKKQDPKLWSNLGFQFYLDKNKFKAITSMLVAKNLNTRYPSVAKGLEAINSEFSISEDELNRCNKRAKTVFELLDKDIPGLPLQTGDMNNFLDPNNPITV